MYADLSSHARMPAGEWLYRLGGRSWRRHQHSSDNDGRLRLRFDIGDLLVRYNLAALRPNGESTDGFVGHNFLTSIGVDWRF